MIPKLFFSHRMDALANFLIEEMDSDPIDPLEIRTVLVPNGQVKQWLLLKIAAQKGIAMGIKILEIEQLLPAAINSKEMLCLIYSALSKSSDPSLISYLQGRKKRVLDLSKELGSLFLKYGEFDASLFENKSGGWQQQLLHKLFVEGPWRLPVQQKMKIDKPIICFGIDVLPPIYWEFLFGAPSLSIYLFSPCMDFWAELSSDRERRSLNRYWKKRGVQKAKIDELDVYLRNGPKILANWGRLGRGTLKIFDSIHFESFEAYPPLEPNSMLRQIQFDLLNYQQTKNLNPDSSIKVLLTGSSKLKEIEALKDEILRLDVPYHEISVLAPDIDPYVPLIEFVFSNEIPYRISGLDAASRSSFRQGLIRILNLCSGRWGAEEVLTLFETPSFHRKLGWGPETLETYRSWIAEAAIDWGFDGDHRRAVLQETLGEKKYEDHSSWEKGLDRLLDALVYFRPISIDADLFESLISVLLRLRELSLKGEKSLLAWAEQLEKTAKEFLISDQNDEADSAAQNAFERLLIDFKKFPDPALFPQDVILHLLNRPCKSQIHSSHLHAVRFARIDEGASIPAKALFMMGMDEESFPKLKMSSSIDLLRGKIPDSAESDRYLFLQAIFSATDFLRISYAHLSADEGKPVGPSLLVQELLSVTGSGVSAIYRGSVSKKKKRDFIWPVFSKTLLPEGELIVSISELRQLARHPWKFFLQKVHGIYLKDELEDSFALEKGQLVRATLGKPVELVLSESRLQPGVFGRAMQLEIREKASEWQTQLQEWELKPSDLYLRESCVSMQTEGSNWIAPPVEVVWENLRVKIVGEIKYATLKGLISPNEDTIAGSLKIWPEALVAAISLGASQIWMLRSGKIKQLANVQESLKDFLVYYFHSLKAPSPLLPEWADPLLRKGACDFKKKMEQRSQFPDPVMEWVFSRAELPCPEEIYENWGCFLKESFKDLVFLYPSRGSYAEI